jgi:hypothetical protein
LTSVDALIRDGEDEGEVSSIASSIFSQTRIYFSLRIAIEEKFVPLAIRNMKQVANIMFVSLLTLHIAQFLIRLDMLSEIRNTVNYIIFSEERISSIIDINLRL